MLCILLPFPSFQQQEPLSLLSHGPIKLPDKDKDKLNALLEYARRTLAWTIADGNPKADLDRFKTTLTDLDKQITSIVSRTGSLSGMLSGLEWKERLQELKKSLAYIRDVINQSKNAPDATKKELADRLNDAISNIQAKEPK